MTWTIDDCHEAPWARHQWGGRLVSLDGTPNDDFTRDDVARVLMWGTTTGDWDGECGGIVQLHDGRYVGWESSWGPTGSGFSADAYGGDADILFARKPSTIWFQLSEKVRELMGEPDFLQPAECTAYILGGVAAVPYVDSGDD